MKMLIEIECPDEGEQPYILEGVMDVLASIPGATGRWQRDFRHLPVTDLWYPL